MKPAVGMGGSEVFELERALLVYARGGGSREGSAYVTIHEVETGGRGAPRLGAGRPADLAFLRRLSEGLQTALPPEVLPAHVLCRTPGLTAWWSPAAVRPMFFRKGSELGRLDGKKFPHPALVWKLDGSELYVRALRASRRPTVETALQLAPYWNTDFSGRVCLGDMKRPESTGVESLREWEAGYFGSLFTGQNGAWKATTRKGGIPGLWKGLRGKPRFPVAALVDAEQSLADFVKGER